MSATRPALEASREQDADIIEVSGVDDDAAMEPGYRLGWAARGCDCTLVVQEVTAIRDIHGEGAVQHAGRTTACRWLAVGPRLSRPRPT